MSVTHDPRSTDDESPPGPFLPPEGRLRLAAHRCTRTPAGVVRIEVELEGADGRRSHGRAEGIAGATVELRLAAAATLQALEHALAGSMRFELLGVKSLRAFDANIVIVAVGTERFGRPTRLLGCVQAAEALELEHAAVLAVLDATNRVSALGTTR